LQAEEWHNGWGKANEHQTLGPVGELTVIDKLLSIQDAKETS
jgi:hypothetical protein